MAEALGQGAGLPERLSELRGHAITQAHALWLDTLERKVSE